MACQPNPSPPCAPKPPQPCPPKTQPPCPPKTQPPCPRIPQPCPPRRDAFLDVDEEPKRERCVEIWHPGYDARFPYSNVTRRCWQNFVDFYRCQTRLGEDDTRCEYFKKAFMSLCPDFWVNSD